MIDPDDHGEIRLLLYKGVKKDYVLRVGDPLGNILVVGMFLKLMGNNKNLI